MWDIMCKERGDWVPAVSSGHGLHRQEWQRAGGAEVFLSGQDEQLLSLSLGKVGLMKEDQRRTEVYWGWYSQPL